MKIDRRLRNRAGELTVYRGEPWAIDNGAYRMWTKGLEYNWTVFERQLLEAAELEAAELPMFAVVPDLPARGAESLRYSLEWLHAWQQRHEPNPPELRPVELAPGSVDRKLEMPWYLAIQDGMTPAMLEEPCPICGIPIEEHFLGLFLGGSSEWKEGSALWWARYARRHGMHFHYGRAGTIAKMRHAAAIGAHSLDSAFPMWTEERWGRFEEAWKALPA
jgi:hypothetical protein